ncbi:hypothetical protein PCANC_12200 [Puccinia coronata f. sp. avenae]|uniref:Uncharacterized protein n=1 Tax=Puccinia coronata f. sp. avenae TaxID=200324 RepID=A0A2N5VF63_9BASI|nr:hypothetical protein PCANC_12200 [Puccinia coronata f. sp. avenae]
MFMKVLLLFGLLSASASGQLTSLRAAGESSSLSRSFSDVAHSQPVLKAPPEPELRRSKTTGDSARSAIDLHQNAPGPMRITCLTIGTRGDVQPYIALCQQLNELGHTCSIATHDKFKDWILESGIGFRSVAGDPEELIKHCTEHRMSPSFWWNGKKTFGPWFDQLLESSWAASKDTDLLIESPSTMVGVHVAQGRNIPYIRAFTMPWTKTASYPHAMTAMRQNWGGWVNKLSYKLFDRLTWLLIRDKVNLWREKQLGLQSTTLAELRLSEVPFLYNFSPSVLPKPSDWGDHVHVTGYWFIKKKKEEANVPEGLKEEIDKAKARGMKVAYIGFGSIIVPDPPKMTDAVIGAVEESKVFTIISGGWTAGASEGSKKGEKANTVPDATRPTTAASKEAAEKAQAQAKKDGDASKESMKAMIGARPESMFYVDSVPHEWLFPQIDAALHHGGAGTTAASIRAGIPTLIKPFFGDQTLWAQSVEHQGVGVHVKSLDKEDILHALVEATTNEDMIIAAKELGKRVDSERGVDTAIQLIYDSMEYSRALIQETRAANLAKPATYVSRRMKKLEQMRSQFARLVEELTFHRFWGLLINLGKRHPNKSEPASSPDTSPVVSKIIKPYPILLARLLGGPVQACSTTSSPSSSSASRYSLVPSRREITPRRAGASLYQPMEELGASRYPLAEELLLGELVQLTSLYQLAGGNDVLPPVKPGVGGVLPGFFYQRSY